jgi:RecB family exonuclease
MQDSLSRNLTKKVPVLTPPKDPNTHFKVIYEVQRLFTSRCDDVSLLRSISDRKTQRLRVQSGMAEKSIQEVQTREDWRATREDVLLSELHEVRFDGLIKKK